MEKVEQVDLGLHGATMGYPIFRQAKVAIFFRFVTYAQVVDGLDDMKVVGCLDGPKFGT